MRDLVDNPHRTARHTHIPSGPYFVLMDRDDGNHMSRSCLRLDDAIAVFVDWAWPFDLLRGRRVMVLQPDRNVNWIVLGVGPLEHPSVPVWVGCPAAFDALGAHPLVGAVDAAYYETRATAGGRTR